MPTRVALFSYDTELQQACREILYEILGSKLVFTVCSEPAGETASSFDLSIWDVQAGTGVLEQLDASRWRNSIILLPKRDLPWFEEKGFPQPNLILKPYTPATLRAHLEQACLPLHHSREAGDGAMQSLYSDRDQLLQSLIRVNLRLQEYDHDRTTFLARATHDLRTPLTALSGYCGLLQSGDLGPLSGDQREVVERMLHSTKRLSRMANAMFQLSIHQRIDQNPRLQVNDICECVDQAVHELMSVLEEKEIVISVSIDPHGEFLAFERSQLELVLINLLDNACEFTPRGGSIEVRGYPFFWERRRHSDTVDMAERRVRETSKPNAFRVDIADSGPCIPESQLAWIFEEYTTHSDSQDRTSGGLGLAICKLILNLHHGRVWAENSPTGAVFSFVLPLR